jgi:hypothetical protein
LFNHHWLQEADYQAIKKSPSERQSGFKSETIKMKPARLDAGAPVLSPGRSPDLLATPDGREDADYVTQRQGCINALPQVGDVSAVHEGVNVALQIALFIHEFPLQCWILDNNPIHQLPHCGAIRQRDFNLPLANNPPQCCIRMHNHRPITDQNLVTIDKTMANIIIRLTIINTIC